MSDRDDEREDSRSLISRLPEMVKSMVVLSLGGVSMAEETLRKATLGAAAANPYGVSPAVESQ